MAKKKKAEDGAPPKMKRKEYERQMRVLHGELVDLKSYSRWYDYSRARDAMLAATGTAWAPWYVADADDKKRARLNIISHLLSQVPYKPLAHRDIRLPRRQPSGGYVPPDLPLRHIPTPF